MKMDDKESAQSVLNNLRRNLEIKEAKIKELRVAIDVVEKRLVELEEVVKEPQDHE